MSSTYPRNRYAPWSAVALLMSLPAGEAMASDGTLSLQAGTCAACHGTDGRSAGSIPTIAGKPFAVLKAQLATFRSGEAEGATVMTRIAKGYDEAELAALARYFSEMKN